MSQHSSISQADDFSSPYARVRSPAHNYDKVADKEEHPYAQVLSTGPGNRLANDDSLDKTDGDDSITLRQSTPEDTLETDGGSQVPIPAASAIAGRISASQDLPYMTPPIYQPGQQHFSGDSQDSSSKLAEFFKKKFVKFDFFQRVTPVLVSESPWPIL